MTLLELKPLSSTYMITIYMQMSKNWKSEIKITNDWYFTVAFAYSECFFILFYRSSAYGTYIEGDELYGLWYTILIFLILISIILIFQCIFNYFNLNVCFNYFNFNQLIQFFKLPTCNYCCFKIKTLVIHILAHSLVQIKGNKWKTK